MRSQVVDHGILLGLIVFSTLLAAALGTPVVLQAKLSPLLTILFFALPGAFFLLTGVSNLVAGISFWTGTDYPLSRSKIVIRCGYIFFTLNLVFCSIAILLR